MFDDPGYVKTGALFFRDRLIMPELRRSWLQSVLPQPVSRNVKQSRLWTGDSGHQQESGVLVVDTYRHFMAMLLVARMNGPDRDGNRDSQRVGVYDMVYGEFNPRPTVIYLANRSLTTGTRRQGNILAGIRTGRRYGLRLPPRRRRNPRRDEDA